MFMIDFSGSRISHLEIQLSSSSSWGDNYKIFVELISTSLNNAETQIIFVNCRPPGGARN